MRYPVPGVPKFIWRLQFQRLDPPISQNTPDTIVTTMKSGRSNNYPLPMSRENRYRNPPEMSRFGSS
jgi:hypothetical protein